MIISYDLKFLKLRLRIVGISTGFLCNCFSCFITASITFTSILYPQRTRCISHTHLSNDFLHPTPPETIYHDTHLCYYRCHYTLLLLDLSCSRAFYPRILHFSVFLHFTGIPSASGACRWSCPAHHWVPVTCCLCIPLLCAGVVHQLMRSCLLSLAVGHREQRPNTNRFKLNAICF